MGSIRVVDVVGWRGGKAVGKRSDEGTEGDNPS